ncbi:DUF6541 family protein [Companilactobacillus zhongbaensis]|uniref:DUF6541 family protein n=1 Tax=Companilactobacillus zhongbaensis TaxID=2486009 RepID=UPI000F7A1996|nr:DUF6541 family protein [Companilactobacillus zhongbaensis]
MKNKTFRTIILGVIFLVLSILYTVLYAPNGSIRLMDSYDMLFHLNRIASLSNIFQSPVNFDYWGQVGNMTSEFYPWLTLIPGYLILQVVGNPVVGFLVFLTVITFATFISAYFFMKKFSDNTLQSFLFSIIYTLSFFRMASVFYRAGLAEYMCYIFIPMLFYEFYQLLSGNFKKWPLFALSFTLIVLTHPLTAFTTVILMLPLVLLVLFTKTAHSWSYWGKLILSGIGSIILVGLTTVGFVLPMIQQQKYISVNRPALLKLSSTAKVPEQLFKDALGTDLRNYSFGVIMLFALLLLVIFIWKDKAKYRLIGIEMLIALVLSTNLIPWDQLQNTFFNYMQFPWRFLNLFTFFASIYIAYGVTKIVDKRSPLLKLLVMILIMAGCINQAYVSGNQLNHQITLAKDPSRITTSNADKYIKQFTQEDYYPVRSLFYAKDLGKHVYILDGERTKLPAKIISNTYTVNYFNQKPETIDFPVLVYKGLNVHINNEAVDYKISERGTAVVKTKPGQNKIVLKYEYSTVAKAALGLNAVGFVLMAWLSINQGRFLPVKRRKSAQEKSLKKVEK